VLDGPRAGDSVHSRALNVVPERDGIFGGLGVHPQTAHTRFFHALSSNLMLSTIDIFSLLIYNLGELNFSCTSREDVA